MAYARLRVRAYDVRLRLRCPFVRRGALVNIKLVPFAQRVPAANGYRYASLAANLTLGYHTFQNILLLEKLEV